MGQLRAYAVGDVLQVVAFPEVLAADVKTLPDKAVLNTVNNTDDISKLGGNGSEREGEREKQRERESEMLAE